MTEGQHQCEEIKAQLETDHWPSVIQGVQQSLAIKKPRAII